MPSALEPPNPTGDHRSRGRFASTDTGRVKAFSDAVFAVAITILATILALGMATPSHHPGGLRSALPRQWPVYLAT
ncbi:MAG: DUF1211 domain-containing protein [Pseudonocardiales bacterium]|nr:DUF1211 domain-containing protein [Pseudonocardiales bacterium]